MRGGRVHLVVALILLFLGLSFNAYACLVPLYGTAGSTMGSGCSTPDEQAARQFCDAFKTLSVQSASELHQLCFDYQAICSKDTALVSVCVILSSHRRYLYEHPADRPPHDLLLKISVLRI